MTKTPKSDSIRVDRWLSNASMQMHMTKARRCFTRDFKLSAVSGLQDGKSLSEVARLHGIHPSMLCRWRAELAEYPEKAFSGNGNRFKGQARSDELEIQLSQAYAEKLLLLALAEEQKKRERTKAEETC